MLAEAGGLRLTMGVCRAWARAGCLIWSGEKVSRVSPGTEGSIARDPDLLSRFGFSECLGPVYGLARTPILIRLGVRVPADPCPLALYINRGLCVLCHAEFSLLKATTYIREDGWP